MFKNLTEWHYPKTIDEALLLLKKGEVVPHAGGTALLRVKSNRIRGLVDLKQLPINSKKEDEQFFFLGAGVKLAQIACWDRLTGAASILKQGASKIASTPLRNRITIGGSIAAPPPWSDMPPVLLALNAQIEVTGTAAGIYSAEQYFQKNPLDGTSLITEVKIPKLPGNAVFKRVTQTKFDYSMLDLAIYLSLQKEVIDEIRVAIGCAVSRAIRLKEVEKFLLKKKPSETLFKEAAQAADFKPLEDRRVSKEYRQELLKILLQRGLAEIIQSSKI